MLHTSLFTVEFTDKCYGIARDYTLLPVTLRLVVFSWRIIREPTVTENTRGAIPMRRLLLFVRTFRKARRLGFGLIDAMRAARVNSYI